MPFGDWSIPSGKSWSCYPVCRTIDALRIRDAEFWGHMKRLKKWSLWLSGSTQIRKLDGPGLIESLLQQTAQNMRLVWNRNWTKLTRNVLNKNKLLSILTYCSSSIARKKYVYFSSAHKMWIKKGIFRLFIELQMRKHMIASYWNEHL